MKTGRPSKFKPEYCDLQPYLKQCEDNKELPTICGYAVFIGTSEKVIFDWKRKNKEFGKSLNELLTIEKRELIEKGLKNLYNATIVKLILGCNHGMSDKIDQNVSGSIDVKIVKH